MIDERIKAKLEEMRAQNQQEVDWWDKKIAERAALPRQVLPKPMLTTLQYEEQDRLIDQLEAEVTEQIRRVRLFMEAFGETSKTAKIEYVLTCVQDDLRRIGKEHDDDDDE